MIEKEFNFRNAETSDYHRIISVVPGWWNGRDLTAMLPEQFFDRFCDTSFVVENGTELIGFLVGFMPQVRLQEAYIQFVAVHPDYRRKSIAATLYEKFFEICRERGRTIVRSITSATNTASIAFHLRMGFQMQGGDKEVSFTKHL